MRGSYRRTRLPATRFMAMETMKLGVKAHYVKGLLEVDVTEARSEIRRKKNEGAQLSFTGWLLKCLASAMKESPGLNAYRKGRNLYMFDTVNIGILVERELKGELVPVPCVIKDCDTKSVADISREIIAVKTGDIGEDLVIADKQAAKLARMVAFMPGFLNGIGIRIFMNNPARKHARMGTIGVTAIGMFGKSGGWPLPIPNVHPLSVAVGGISRKPVYVGERDEIRPRDMLDLTLMFDHDVIDGAPAARYSARLVELMESAHGLE